MHTPLSNMIENKKPVNCAESGTRTHSSFLKEIEKKKPMMRHLVAELVNSAVIDTCLFSPAKKRHMSILLPGTHI